MWAPLQGFMYGPRSLICTLARDGTSGKLRGSGAAYPALTVQGRRGEGRQGPRLLRRVLSLCLLYTSDAADEDCLV